MILLGAALLLGGCTYAFLCRLLGFGLPCPIRIVTGLKCPGCGISRMCLRLLEGDLRGTWAANPAILCLLPLGAAVGMDVTVRYVRTGKALPGRWANVALLIMIAVLLAFGVWRNVAG